MSQENVEIVRGVYAARSRWAVTVVAVFSSLLVGCGGGETTVTTSAGQPLSRQDFVEQANAICKAGNVAATNVERPSDLPGLVSAFDQLESIARDMVGKLAALTPPSDLRDGFRHLLSDARQQLPLLAKLKAAAQAGDPQQLRSIAQHGEALNRGFSSDARALGLSDCANSVQPPG